MGQFFCFLYWEFTGMSLLILILLIVGFVCFLVAAFNLVAARVNLVALGLACWILTAIIDTWPK